MINERDPKTLGKTDQLFRLLIDTKDYAIITLDPDGHIVGWNIGAEYIVGYQYNEVKGRHFSLCHADAQMGVSVNTCLQQSLVSGRFERECRMQKKDASEIFTNLIYTPLRSDDGSLQGYAVLMRDVTREKQLARENKALHDSLEERVKQRTHELEVANKELNAFSYSVSHDLRTPLRAINGFAKLLQEDYQSKLDDEGNRVLNVIIESADMMGQLIDDLLTFSRLSRLEVADQIVDMRALAESNVTQLQQAWNRSECEVTIGALPPCNADPAMMKQVWMNLIENAFKYSSKQDHPKINIGFKQDNVFYTYFITDNGVGFDMKYAANLFGVFQRLHTMEEFPGTGLGLALVSRIIAKHGGTIWAESELDKGATFYFTIPKRKQYFQQKRLT